MIPEIFKERMKRLLWDEYDDFIKSLECGEPVRALRVNNLKISEEEFLKACNFKLEEILPYRDAYRFYEDKIGASPLHHAGAFYSQDPSAMAPVTAAEEHIWPGMRVLDMCAAPGGKTSQLASLLGGEGVLYANEKVASRARILEGNIERMGIRNAVVTNLSTDAVAKNFCEYFDFVLCDAPCSGEGMFRKYENAGEEWSIQNVELCAKRQAEILDDCAAALCLGGYLMYSTCTFSEEENEMCVLFFLERHPEFEISPVFSDIADITSDGIGLKEARRFYPHKAMGEGQFMCLLHKKDGGRTDRPTENNLVKLSKDEKKLAEDFLLDMLGYIPEGLYKLRDNIVIADELCAPNGTFSCGVTLGEVNKGRLVPHHHFFSAYGRDMLRRAELSLDDERVEKYLRGESIEYEMEKGWCAVSVSGCTIGGGKAVDGFIKNHYPKGLRQRD